jgi:hypothetical protein
MLLPIAKNAPNRTPATLTAVLTHSVTGIEIVTVSTAQARTAGKIH